MPVQNFNPGKNILPYEGEVFYLPGFFTAEKSEFYFKYFSRQINWKQEPVKIFGKTVMQPRLTCWFGERSYSYSGITMPPQDFPPLLDEIRQQIERFSGELFNSALCNYYRDGNDSMGWHRDNEKALGPKPVIASLTFGAERRFLLRNYKNKPISRDITLSSGSLLLMRGETQHYWEHSLPKTAKITGPRINITLRQII